MRNSIMLVCCCLTVLASLEETISCAQLARQSSTVDHLVSSLIALPWSGLPILTYTHSIMKICRFVYYVRSAEFLAASISTLIAATLRILCICRCIGVSLALLHSFFYGCTRHQVKYLASLCPVLSFLAKPICEGNICLVVNEKLHYILVALVCSNHERSPASLILIIDISSMLD